MRLTLWTDYAFRTLIYIGAKGGGLSTIAEMMGCLSEPGFCRIEGCCVLRRALREATLAFLDVLDRYTLADLLLPDRYLADSLGLAPAIRLSTKPDPAVAADAGSAQHG